MGFLDRIANITNPSSIDDLKAVINKRTGLARQNRINIIMTPPQAQFLNNDWGGLIQQALTGNLGLNDFVNDPRDVALLCESCSMPGRDIQTQDVQHKMVGQNVKFATGYAVEDVSMTFLLTNDYYLKKVMEKWQNTIVDPNTFNVGYRKDYTSDIIIQQLDQNNRVVYGVKLLEAYPSNVSALTLDNTAADSIQKITVAFSYRDYKPEGGLNSLISGGKGLLDNVQKLF